MTNKHELRSKARSASAGEWIKESGEGWEAICSSDDQANAGFIVAHFEGPDAKANREFIQAANPDTVLALLDELEAAEKRLSEITAPNMLLPAIDDLDENQLRNVIKTCTENYSLLHSKCEAAEKRVAELEAVKFKLSDSKLLLLAKDIVENLVDTGSSEPEYTQQYLDWTCKRIRAAGRINGEG